MEIWRLRSCASGRRRRAVGGDAGRGGEFAGAEANRRYTARFGLRFAPKRRARHGEAIKHSAVDWGAAETARNTAGRRRAAVHRR
jgi:hypothetical protein